MEPGNSPSRNIQQIAQVQHSGGTPKIQINITMGSPQICAKRNYTMLPKIELVNGHVDSSVSLVKRWKSSNYMELRDLFKVEFCCLSKIEGKARQS